ncbi:MAG: MFS transporter [Verrucomicrobia bacterium]|nr:MFS transporter [Verrucomicrobiota bacterium]
MSSSWTALRYPVFRRLWIASAISGTCVAAHDNAATYVLNSLSGNPALLSLIPVVIALPFFLFTLPAGMLADRVDRKKLLCAINLWLAAGAFSLAIFNWLHILNSYLILACIFFIGIGFAANAPVSTAVVATLVPETELSSVATLNGLQFNISGILGPALGGLLLPLIGANQIFLINAACFLFVILAVQQWKESVRQSPASSKLQSPGRNSVIHSVFRTPTLQRAVAQNLQFAFFISAIPAVVPVIGLKLLNFTSSDLGLCFTFMGIGSASAAVLILPRLKKYFPGEILTLSNVCIAVVYVLFCLIHEKSCFLLTASLAGAGWTISASELWARGQSAIPDWARGRLTATMITVSQGATALGALVWSSLVATIGPSHTLITTALLFSASILLSNQQPLLSLFVDRLPVLRLVRLQELKSLA